MQRRLQREWGRHGDHVGCLDVDPVRRSLLRIEIERHLNERVRANDGGRCTLNNRHIRAGFPEIQSDIMSRARGADHDAVLTPAARGVAVAA